MDEKDKVKDLGQITEESREIMSIDMPGTSKAITVFNAGKVGTLVLNENTVLATELLENLKTSNAQEKVTSGPKKKGRKRKAPSISEMVVTSIKKIKKKDGVSFEDIKKHMEENYPVKVKALLKYHVSNFLQKFVEKGFLEITGGVDMERFLIKESEFREN